MIYSSILELIGHTPLLQLNAMKKDFGFGANIFAKLERFNPAGSIKDRVALNMILDAEKRGLIVSGATIIEPTSGNTGVGLALICAVKGYNLILTMPESMSVERRQLLISMGAKLELTPAAEGMAGALRRAEELKNEAVKIRKEILEIKNAIEREELEKAYLESIETLRYTVEAKDTYTRGHSDRVAAYAVLIGEKMGLSKEELKTLKIGGLFHDIGKIGVPDSILLKTSKLTDDEYSEIKNHPSIGKHILSSASIFNTFWIARPLLALLPSGIW